MKQTININFDNRNLSKGEEILFTFKPYKKSYMIRNFFVGGGIPFPFALAWAIIDFGILFGVPLGTGEYWLWAVLIPFMSIHGTPIWIWLYGVIRGVKDYYQCGHIITTKRIVTRLSRKEPFKEYLISDIKSITVLSNKKFSTTINISFNSENASLMLRSLEKKDADHAIELLYKMIEKESQKKTNEKYKTKCMHCGGRVKNGYCLYCDSRAEKI